MIVAEMCDSDASVGQTGFVFGIKLQGFCSLEEAEERRRERAGVALLVI